MLAARGDEPDRIVGGSKPEPTIICSILLYPQTARPAAEHGQTTFSATPRLSHHRKELSSICYTSTSAQATRPDTGEIRLAGSLARNRSWIKSREVLLYEYRDRNYNVFRPAQSTPPHLIIAKKARENAKKRAPSPFSQLSTNNTSNVSGTRRGRQTPFQAGRNQSNRIQRKTTLGAP